MDSTFTLNWQGDLVAAKTRHACAWGIDSVMADCVVMAKGLVPKRTTILQGSIGMTKAVDQGSEIVGLWGSFATNYARWVEEGTRPHFPPVSAIQKGMKVSEEVAWRIAFSISKKGTKPHPFLMPSAQRFYPGLAQRISAKLAFEK
jgi:hypothetical protein